jgi:DNA-binding transcriptional ArsR family regulator
MTEKKYLLISMDDDRAKKLAEVLGNKTCKKIIDLLAEKDASEKEIATALKVPINTIEYNLKKLINAEIIEKSKTFFWSQKGKKIDIYKLSNKSIIISPKNKVSSKIKSILPAILVTFVGAIAIKYYHTVETTRKLAQDNIAGASPTFAQAENIFVTSQPFPIWGWFLAGAIFALLIVTIINWRKL